ncbi:hypothetical protein CCR87_05115 [Rhodobaculum claviforme]|uniref:Uncharacterized protein n=1 Tax=Rhodobaculum claviforme TaxID=1549854 RepID=A0A934WID6_9RHOB|nr:hypothetical protein [Rhodobaculum claviforme]
MAYAMPLGGGIHRVSSALIGPEATRRVTDRAHRLPRRVPLAPSFMAKMRGVRALDASVRRWTKASRHRP